MSDDSGIFVTASVLVEYLFCPRFIYFMNCLNIGQNEDKRYKVIKGRNAHGKIEKTNVGYLRRRIGCLDKKSNIFMASDKYHIKGVVDEVLTLSDGTMAPLDYKYAEYRGTVFDTQRYQSVFYGLLIRENFERDVKRGFICYTRSKNRLLEIPIIENDFTDVMSMVHNIIDITRRCRYPEATLHKTQCPDCCYRRICIR